MNVTQGIQLVDYVRAIRRRWPVVLMVTFLVVAAALTVSLASEKQYDAEAQLLFGGEQAAEIISDGAQSAGDPERDLNTLVELIKLDTVASGVRRRLGLNTPLNDLAEQITTETSSSSDLVTLAARDTDARRAAALANAWVEEYVSFRRRSERQSLVAAAELAQTRYDALSPTEQQTEQGRQLRARQRELEITAALQTGGVQVVRRATAPTAPSRPRPRLSAVVGGLLGLLLGAALALALEFADRRLKDEEAIEEFFDLPLLAAIPPPPRRGADDHLQREAYGMLAANVRLATTGESHAVIVTSPSPGDGKTSVSIGLARALARLGARVILIEADLRRPAVGEYTGLASPGGLTSLLSGASNHLAHELVWVDAGSMKPVTLDDLKEGISFALLTAGRTPDHPQRLLARPEMAATLETARSLADVVIIDTPPIGTVNDSVALSRMVDSVVVVARLNKTTKDAARRSLRTLRNLSAQLLGVVATDARVGEHYGYYGHDESREREGSSPIASIKR